MSGGWVKVADGDQSVFAAVLVSAALREHFRAATGWAFAVEHHRYEGSAHWVSAADHEQLSRVVDDQAASQPRFWLDYGDRAAVAADRLLGTAWSVAALAAGTASPVALRQGLRGLSAAIQQVAPYAIATPYVQAVLERQLRRRIDLEAPVDSPLRGGTAGNTHRQLRGPAHPEALAELRDCYRIGVELASNPHAAEILHNTSPAITSGWVDDHCPELAARIRRHLGDYGWLWGRGQPNDARTPMDLVERIQAVLLRWPIDAVRELAAPRTTPSFEAVLGFSPSDPLADLLGAYRRLTTDVGCRIDVLDKAQGIAAPFFTPLADIDGCTGRELLWSTPHEIHAALAGAQLPAVEIDRRMREGFTVEGAGDVGLPAAGHRTAGAGPGVQGGSASRGLAVGTVKVMFGRSEIGRLALGDVLVTATSSPDVFGGASMFPSRAGLSVIEMAAAVVTDEGGALSHAGIVSREHGIPCVVGTGRATSTFVDGQVVEVDARRPTGRVAVLGSRSEPAGSD